LCVVGVNHGERLLGSDRDQRAQDDRHRLSTHAGGRQLRPGDGRPDLHVLPRGLRRPNRPGVLAGGRVRRDPVSTAQRHLFPARGALHVLRRSAGQVQGQGSGDGLRSVPVPVRPTDRRL